MKLRYFYSLKFILLFQVVASIPSAHAQYQDSVLKNKREIDSILITEHLNQLEGMPKTFYSKGYSIRAKALQKLVYSCELFYEKHFIQNTFLENIYVLNKYDWEKPPFGVPYGLPSYFPENKLEIISADKNALARLSGKPDDPVKSDSIISGYDYVGIHELGHYFFETLNRIRTEKWFDEFLANYFLICYVYETKIDFDIKTFFMPEGNPLHKTIQDFNTFYEDVGPANYDWYQREFIQLGIKLYPRLKLTLIEKVIENFSPEGKHLDPLSLLKNLSPDITKNWLMQMQ
ncbi:MAG TPA: hypothetical protein VHD35_12730 [Chitinophagaceae bacterium]|nr:hypothetical protein [Chitinophagaceae bacterium]